MALTFLDLYNECAGQPWSMYDNDAESVDDFESALKGSINKAISYLWNYQPWSFKEYTHLIRTRANKTEYEVPIGTIIKRTVDGDTLYDVKSNGNRLEYIKSIDSLDEKEGEPEYFNVHGEKFNIYPTPDDSYLITINYLLLPYGLNDDEEFIYELKEDEDRVNVPEKYEVLFKNCVIALAMIYAIADESDENHSGYLKMYNDALQVLMSNCSEGLEDKRIVF